MARERRYWALAFNPEVYRGEDRVRETNDGTWTSRGSDIRTGDRALIWRGKGKGGQPGVVALAQVERTIELALAEARRALTYQAGSVDELRSRTGVLLAAAAITGSFLGSAAANQGHLGVLGIVAVVAFVAAVGCCLWILRPREWTFVTSPKTLLEDWADTEREQDVRRFLAEALEGHYDDNKKQTDRLMKWFQFAAVSVGAAVILGSLELTTSI